MERFIAVDTGKFATKVSEADANLNCLKREFSIRTKYGEGDFRDDAIEAQTVIAQVGDKVYKVGNGARDEEAGLDTSKKTEIHKVCTLVALATVASSNEKDVFHVATGIPCSEWANVSKRCDFKEYLLPEGDITVTIKTKSSLPPVKKTFTIKERYVYPEGIGGVLADGVFENVSENPHIPTGVIDAGNLNINFTYWQGLEPILDKCTTSEAGGVRLISDVAGDISSSIDNCDSLIISNILTNAPEDRCLPSGLGLTDEQIEESKRVIKNSIKKYVQKNMYRNCRSKDWSLNAMRIIAIGGTSQIVEDELKEQFGNVTVLPNANYCNARGYLRLMCANSKDYGERIIEFKFADEEKNETKMAEKEAGDKTEQKAS